MKRYVVLALSAFALSGLIATPALAAKGGGGTKQVKHHTPLKAHHCNR
jgi:hypothetical protein